MSGPGGMGGSQYQRPMGGGYGLGGGAQYGRPPMGTGNPMGGNKMLQQRPSAFGANPMDSMPRPEQSAPTGFPGVFRPPRDVFPEQPPTYQPSVVRPPRDVVEPPPPPTYQPQPFAPPGFSSGPQPPAPTFMQQQPQQDAPLGRAQGNGILPDNAALNSEDPNVRRQAMDQSFNYFRGQGMNPQQIMAAQRQFLDRTPNPANGNVAPLGISSAWGRG